MRGRRSPALAALSAITLVGSLAAMAASAHAWPPRVPPRWFGTNINSGSLSAPWAGKELRAIRAAGLRRVRLALSWANFQPKPPGPDGQNYRFAWLDRRIALIAHHHLAIQLVFGYTPSWDAYSDAEYRQCRERGAASARPYGLVPYARAIGALARRYGPRGSFWRKHPHLPYRPIRQWEIWNAPNTAGSWCPAAEPARYGMLFELAARAVRRNAPHTRIIVGGLGLNPGRNPAVDPPPGPFLQQATAAFPGMRNAAAVAVHVYPFGPLSTLLDPLPAFRQALRQGGFSDSTPMLVNEFGWTRVGPYGKTEPERVERYRSISRRLPRTNCNVSGMLAFTWGSRERDLSNPEDFFGIWNPVQGPYPSARAYSRSVRSLRGQLARRPPRRTIQICAGMPLPDHDRDGVPDQGDRHPLNPHRG